MKNASVVQVEDNPGDESLLQIVMSKFRGVITSPIQTKKILQYLEILPATPEPDVPIVYSTIPAKQACQSMSELAMPLKQTGTSR